MPSKMLVLLTSILMLGTLASAQTAGLKVKVQDEQGRDVSGASVSLMEESIGAYTSADGEASFTGLQARIYRVVVAEMTMQADTQQVQLVDGETTRLEVQLVSAFSTQPIEIATRADASVSPSLNVQQLNGVRLDQLRVVSLAEGLQFSPGLQIETNCQNCGYTQLRMNGLAGPYTQFLINGRPIFGEMAAIYALEQVPTKLIDRIEIVRGAGSVVAGANAIAGTVNLITRRPTADFFEISSTIGVMDGGVLDPVATANLGVVNDEATAGMMVFGQVRQRQAYDRNDDNVSELPKMNTQTLGLTAFFKPTKNTVIDMSAGVLSEARRGGAMQFDLADHQTEVSESIEGNSMYYDLRLQQTLDTWQLAVFGGGMHTRRDNYYGAGFDPDAYGYTREDNLNAGASISRRAIDDRLLVVAGVDMRYHDVIDEYPGYDRLLEQEAWLTGGFLQASFDFTDWLTLDAGVRADYHNLLERAIANPRVGLSGTAGKWSYRANFAQGYRPPVAANEVLHMALIGGELRQVALGADLDAELSQSITGGVTRRVSWKGGTLLAKLDGFYTTLSNTFIYEPLEGVGDGLTFEMRNGGDSRVMGATLELELRQNWLNIRSGWTYQQTQLDEPAVWSDMLEGAEAESDEYLRTPDWYGYVVATVEPILGLQLTAEANLTGSMFAPHYGVSTEDVLGYFDEVPNTMFTEAQLLDGTVRTDALTQTPVFAELGLHAAYTFKLKRGLTLTLKAGGRNLLNSFQDDYDAGSLRDAGYIYGPHIPRTVYGGFSLSY